MSWRDEQLGDDKFLGFCEVCRILREMAIIEVCEDFSNFFLRLSVTVDVRNKYFYIMCFSLVGFCRFLREMAIIDLW